MTNLIQYKRIESTSESGLMTELNAWLLENTPDFTEDPEIMKSRDYDYKTTPETVTFYAEIKYKTKLADYKAAR